MRATRIPSQSLAILLAPLAAALPAPAQDEPKLAEIQAPPAELVESLELAPFYAKHLDAGFPILASAKVADAALREAKYLVDHMLTGRDDVRRRLAANKVRFVVMAVDEYTTDVPEHADLEPPAYWDVRARGLGATRWRPAVSCGEENLLRYPGDPYAAENILIHEFAHAIHQMALSQLDRTFDQRLKAAYDAAMEEGLWEGLYAASNPAEYWAEGVQSWFDTNRPPDHDHNHVDTRAELREYDPRLAKLIEAEFGDRDWRYVRPEDREPADRAHLAGYDREQAPRFAWPEEKLEAYRKVSEERK